MATRVRRGKEVEIPAKWVGVFPTRKTMRERPSRMIGKLARKLKLGVAYKDAKDIPL